MRYTKKDAIGQVKRLANVLGLIYGYNQGNIMLSKTYSGYQIVKIGKGKSESALFDNSYHTAKDIYHLCNFAMRAIQLDRLNGEDSASYWPKNKYSVN